MHKKYKLTHTINAGAFDSKSHTVYVSTLHEAILVREALADCTALFNNNIVSNTMTYLQEEFAGEYLDYMDENGNIFDDYQLVNNVLTIKE